MVRKTLLFGLIFSMSLSLTGQNFISEDKQWSVRFTGGWPVSLTTEIFIIDGDSAVNSIIYNKVWVSFDSLDTWQYQGLLREDANVVYYIPPNGGDEGILYDFNLEVGDTAYVTNIFCSDIPIYVLDVDTVEYFGTSRKRWTFGGDGYAEEAWLEGIGSLYGPLYTKYEYCIICPVWELLCYHNDGVLEYIMDGQTDCYQTTVGINELKEDIGFDIYPNPVSRGDIIYLEMKSVPGNIMIYNSAGLLIRNFNPVSGKEIVIETNDLQPGLYLIAITNSDNRLLTGKIIVQ
jgi:hypothetical protein